MSRRYQEIEERDRHDVDRAKAILKRLGDSERALLMRWLLKYFEDDGRIRLPQSGNARRVIAIDGTQYWIVAIALSRLTTSRR